MNFMRRRSTSIFPAVTRLRIWPFIVTVMFSPTIGWAGSIVTPFLSLHESARLAKHRDHEKRAYGMRRCLEGLPQSVQIGGGTGSSGASSGTGRVSATGSSAGSISSIIGCCICCSALTLAKNRHAKSAKPKYSRSDFMVDGRAFDKRRLHRPLYEVLILVNAVDFSYSRAL